MRHGHTAHQLWKGKSIEAVCLEGREIAAHLHMVASRKRDHDALFRKVSADGNGRAHSKLPVIEGVGGDDSDGLNGVDLFAKLWGDWGVVDQVQNSGRNLKERAIVPGEDCELFH